MIRRFASTCLIWLLSVALAPVVVAQEAVISETAAVEVVSAADSFDRIAQRAEELAARDDASMFAVSRLRAELVGWRTTFLHQTTVNAARIATVDAQLSALGPAPDGGSEAEAVTARRAALIAQRSELVAPRLLAQEAYARANGLIGEFDALSLQRQTGELTARGPTPLNPTYLVDGAATLWALVQVIGVEAAAGFRVRLESGQFLQNAPRVLVLLGFGIALLGAGRRIVSRWRTARAGGDRLWSPLAQFVLSTFEFLVPLLGLFALREGLQELDIFGLRGGDVIATIPVAGSFVLLGWWISRHMFPSAEDAGYFGYDARNRSVGRHASMAAAWVMALDYVMDAGLRTMDVSVGAQSAIAWVPLALLGILLWRIGVAIGTKPEAVDGTDGTAGRIRHIAGLLARAVAVVAPLIGAAGYTAAGTALIVPAIETLALLGALFLVQRIVGDIAQQPTDGVDKNAMQRGAYAMLPVIITSALYLASLPFFALIWGARVSDLIELWSRFREGFQIGNSRISPTDFLAFAAVFAVGYVVTRFIQGTLRKSVLPRTRLDLGAQNALVAGFGYVGIMLAALAAITTAGLDLSSLAIVAGALSVGIGFGLQNIVSNFVSGIILLIERPVSEGDWIEVNGQMGYVRAISVRSTRIETFDRTDVIVPNADLVSGQVTNWTRGNLIGRVKVPVGVAYGTDVDKVTEILRGIAEAHPLVVMTPPPAVLFIGFGADSLDFEIRAILRDVNYVLSAKSDMNHAINKAFAEAGIEIPFAQRDLWLRNPDVLKDNPAI